jgi:hypothetical protein
MWISRSEGRTKGIAMVKMMSRSGRTLEIERDMIEVSTQLPQPDPHWSYTDRAGHEHAYGTKGNPYPTLARRQGEPYWCAECQDEHVDTWLECPLCAEVIEPGTYIAPSPQYLPGYTLYRIDGQEVSKEEGEALLAEMQADREAEAQRKKVEAARKAAGNAEQAMLDEGLDEEQVQRVINRMVHGNPDGSA